MTGKLNTVNSLKEIKNDVLLKKKYHSYHLGTYNIQTLFTLYRFLTIPGDKQTINLKGFRLVGTRCILINRQSIYTN